MTRVTLIAALLATTALPAAAWAQTAPIAEGTSTDVSDIIVTAQKREQRLIDVPIALAAITGETLEARGADNLGDFIQESPGVSFYDLGTGQTKVAIRGISAELGGNENGYYLDDLPFTSVSTTFAPDVRTWDLDRVEVLRGPQGTLFGEGSLGGTVRILTADADLNDFIVKGSGSLSSTEDGGVNTGVKAAVNLPIIQDRLAVRVAGTHEEFSGWTDNAVTGESDVNDQEIDTVRVRARAQPTDWLTLRGSYWYYDSAPTIGSNALDNGDIPQSANLANAQHYELIGGSANADLGFANLFYAYGHNEQETPVTGRLLGGDLLIADFIEIDSHELRLSSQGDDALKWTIGLYARNATRDSTLELAVLGLDNFTRVTTEARAVFGEATYTLPFAPIDLTAGLRYFEDDLQGYDINFGVTTQQPGGKFDSWNPKFNISWRPNPDLNVYATAAKGFRSGQLQPISVQQIAPLFGIILPVALDSDSLWSYEIGFKANLLNRRLFFEGAAYHMDWDKVTVRRPIANTGLNGLINSNGTISDGAELNLVAHPGDDFTFTVGASYVDARYDGAVPGTQIDGGEPVDSVSKVSYNASAEYGRQIGPDLFINGRLSYQHFSPRKISAFDYPAGDTIDTVSARVSLDFRQVNVALYADNITNEDGATNYRAVDPATLETYAPRLRPRTVGLEASFRFGG